MFRLLHCFVLCSLILFSGCHREEYDLVIRNVNIYDGTGNTAYTSDVGIRGDTIAALGDLGDAGGKIIIDGDGFALAPGFIDTHSHHDRGLFDHRDALAVVSQGVTTIIVGQDGGSELPLRRFFQRLNDSPVAVNVGSYSGHNTIRDRVMGKDFKRVATHDEIIRMEAILREDLDAGALGLSTGLEYDPGIYSDRKEVLALAKGLKPFNGRYISHLRSEDRYFWDALQEILIIGDSAEVPVQISHFKLAMANLWDKADSALHILDAARKRGVNVTADIYPYPYWSSDIRVLFPLRNFEDEKEAAFVLKEVARPDGIIFSDYEPKPEYNGKSLTEVAESEKLSPERMLIEAIRLLEACDNEKGNCDGSIVATSMKETDIVKLMKWKYANICSDGASSGLHPRGFGAFTRILSQYVLETSSLTLPEAIHKMTLLSAENLGIKKRGLIKPGHFADMVMFDPNKVKDNATVDDPQAISSGIKKVWVNGTLVFDDSSTTKKYPGRVIFRDKR